MKQGEDQISMRQLMAMIWAGLLSPAVGVLPGITAAVAGEGAWLSAAVAAPFALAGGWIIWRLCRRGERALGEAFCQTLGRGWGRALTALYLLWAVALLAVRLRLGSQRMLLTGQRDGGVLFFLPVVLALAVWMAWGKLAAFARAAELFFRVLALTLGCVTVLAVFQVRGENLLPVWWTDLPAAARSAGPALGVLCYGSFAGFFLDCVAAGERARRPVWLRWTLGGCAALAAMQLVVVGSFGAPLTARLEIPFITLAKSIGVEGAFQRVEGLVAAVWILSDLALLTLLLRACCRMAQVILPKARPHLTAGAVSAAALLLSAVLLRDPVATQRLGQGAVLAGNLILGAGVPAVVLLLANLREGRKGGSTSCGRAEEKAIDIGEGPPPKKSLQKE